MSDQRPGARMSDQRPGARMSESGPGEPLVWVNGEPVEVAPGTTVADLVTALLDEADPKGVAVAVDRCVVPRSEWATTPAAAGSQVEVVSAAAGG